MGKTDISMLSRLPRLDTQQMKQGSHPGTPTEPPTHHVGECFVGRPGEGRCDLGHTSQLLQPSGRVIRESGGYCTHTHRQLHCGQRQVSYSTLPWCNINVSTVCNCLPQAVTGGTLTLGTSQQQSLYKYNLTP